MTEIEESPAEMESDSERHLQTIEPTQPKPLMKHGWAYKFIKNYKKAKPGSIEQVYGGEQPQNKSYYERSYTPIGRGKSFVKANVQK